MLRFKEFAATHVRPAAAASLQQLWEGLGLDLWLVSAEILVVFRRHVSGPDIMRWFAPARYKRRNTTASGLFAECLARHYGLLWHRFRKDLPESDLESLLTAALGHALMIQTGLLRISREYREYIATVLLQASEYYMSASRSESDLLGNAHRVLAHLHSPASPREMVALVFYLQLAQQGLKAGEYVEHWKRITAHAR